MYRVNHLVPQQMFSTETAEVQGISAVKALAIASQQGQKIWTINQSNLDLALSRINLGADAENDIRNAVYAGKVATAHEARINFNGWIGEGYTLIDPNTGTGAYMISGGGNGAILVILGISMLLLLLIAVGTGFGTVLALFILFSALALISAGIERIAIGLESKTWQAVGCGFKWIFISLVVGRLLALLPLIAPLLTSMPWISELFSTVIGGAGVFACL